MIMGESSSMKARTQEVDVGLLLSVYWISILEDETPDFLAVTVSRPSLREAFIEVSSMGSERRMTRSMLPHGRSSQSE